jgi:hypothetical protein
MRKTAPDRIRELEAIIADQARRIEELSPEEGTVEGETCNRDGCKGVIDVYEKDPCSCHLCAPCAACCHNYEHCPECGWEPEQP